MKKRTDNKSLAIIDGNTLTERGVMESINNVIIELHQTGDINQAMNVLDVMEKIGHITGHAKAKLVWAMQDWWEQTGQSNIREIEFKDFIEDAKILKETSLDRYLIVQEYIESLDIPKEFHSRPIRDLVPIAKALSQGYDIPKNAWDSLRLSSNLADVGRIIRDEVKKKKPRKNARSFEWARDGSLYGWKDDVRYYLGYLDKVEFKNSPIAKEFINLVLDKINARRK